MLIPDLLDTPRDQDYSTCLEIVHGDNMAYIRTEKIMIHSFWIFLLRLFKSTITQRPLSILQMLWHESSGFEELLMNIFELPHVETPLVEITLVEIKFN